MTTPASTGHVSLGPATPASPGDDPSGRPGWPVGAGSLADRWLRDQGDTGDTADDMTWLEALAGIGLRGAAVELPRTGWGERIDGVAAQGLSGLLVRAVEAGVVELDRDEAALLVGRHEPVLVRSLRHEAELVRLHDVMAGAGAVVLKGPAFAHGVYADPADRPFGDLDVLVAPRSMRSMIEQLVSLGYRRPWPDPTPRYVELVAKAVCLTHPAGLSVDLHRTLVPGPLEGSIPTGDILAEAIEITAGAFMFRAPRWEHHLIEAALHGAVGHAFTRPLALRDVAQIIVTAPIDPQRLVTTAEDWGVAVLLAETIRRVERAFSMAVPHGLGGWAQGRATSASEHERRQLAACLSPAHRSATLRLSELREGSARRRIELARALLAPAPSYLRHLQGDAGLPTLYLTRWRTLATRARRGSVGQPGRSPSGAEVWE
jgi:Uncharacterised nucleotidyltransferase